MFTSIIRTIIGTKFQINPLTITLFSGSGPKIGDSISGSSPGMDDQSLNF